jgi:hypothetical protein
MAFGNAVTEFSQVAVGAYGYTIRVDASTLRPHKIANIQIQASPTSTSAPVTNEVSANVLSGYLENSDCPDVAFNFSGSEVLIFLKTAIYPYISTTRLAFGGLRNAQETTADTDYIDVPARDIDYLCALCMARAYKLQQRNMPQAIREDIELHEEAIRNES